MADKNKESKDQREVSQTSPENLSGEPGRTPGAAEGDRETVEQSLRDKEEKGQI